MKGRTKTLIAIILLICAYVCTVMKVLYPLHRMLSLALSTGAWLFLAAAVWQKRAHLRKHKRKVHRAVLAYGPHILLAAALAYCTYAAWVLTPALPSPLTDMTTEDLRENMRTDAVRVAELEENLWMILGDVESRGLFSKPFATLSDADRQRIDDSWDDFLALNVGLDRLKDLYRGFYQLDYVAHPALHADAFYLAMRAFTAQILASIRMAELGDGNPYLQTYLNQAGKSREANTFFMVKQRPTHHDVLLQLNAGAAYFMLVRKDFSGGRDWRDLLSRRIEDVYSRLGQERDLFMKNPMERFEKEAFAAWFPIQKGIAVQMSRVRTAQRDYFIKADALAEYEAQLEPLDILLERRNWHLTNIGIPGFWPHVALYLGRFTDLDTFFDGIDTPEGKAPSASLATRFPEACRAWQEADAKGQPLTVIEALEDGVVLTAFSESGHADYLAAIRPRLSRQEKFTGLARALSHWGKPYDYNFDFATDDKLVCSELVCKALEGLGSISLPVEEINGRMLLPPNRIAQLFDEHYAEPSQVLDFVFFLRGRESDGTAEARERIDFRRSWKLPKWDVMQE